MLSEQQTPWHDFPQALDKSQGEHWSILQAVATGDAGSATTVLAPGCSYTLNNTPRWGLGPWSWKKSPPKSKSFDLTSSLTINCKAFSHNFLGETSCFREGQLVNTGTSYSSNYQDGNNPAHCCSQRTIMGNVSWNACSEQAQDFPRLLLQGSPQWLTII